MNFTYETTVVGFADGEDGTPGRGATFGVVFGGTWAAGDTYQFDIVTAPTTFNLGSSDITKKVPRALMTLDKRLHFVADAQWFFSALGDPQGYNQQDLSAGNLELDDRYAAPEPQAALNPYQGRVAAFGRHSTQIWQIDADPSLFQQTQVLQNIGTLATLSVNGLGDLDCLFLADTGIRALRPLENTLNATQEDVGAPVDTLVLADLEAISATEAAAACSIVEPASNRYWLYLNGHIYVLSYFRAAKIVAWSQYTCTFFQAGVEKTFIPQKFVIFEGQVYVLATVDGVLVVMQYGGEDNNSYDATVAEFSTDWLDAGKPGTNKTFDGMDAAIVGTWQLAFGVDYQDDEQYDVTVTGVSTFDLGKIPVAGTGSFCRIAARTTGATAARFATALIHYQENDEH